MFFSQPAEVYSSAHKAARTANKSPKTAKRMATEARNRRCGLSETVDRKPFGWKTFWVENL